MKNNLYLSIDIGTTLSKGIVIDQYGRTKAEFFIKHNTITTKKVGMSKAQIMCGGRRPRQYK